MSCNQDFFVTQEGACKDTYLSNLPKNIDYMIYRGGYNKLELNNHILQLPCEDDLNNTFKKTYQALLYINQNYDYDFVFRTNTSTYVNVPLLNYFCNHVNNEKQLWCSEICYRVDNEVNYKYHLYPRGNALLLTQYHINIIIQYGLPISMLSNLRLIDDEIIGSILNSTLSLNNEKYTDYISSYKEAWYRAINQGSYPSSVSDMGNTNISFTYLKQFMVIQVKNWYNRNDELKHLYELHHVFSCNQDNNLEKTYNDNISYSKNPDIFLGNTYGFQLYKKIFTN